MEMKILTNKKNALLNRQEVIAEEDGKTVPSKAQVREKLAALLNISTEQIVITKIESKYGSHKSVISANAYDNKENMKKNEGMPYLKRNFEEFKAKKGQQNDAPPAPKK